MKKLWSSRISIAACITVLSVLAPSAGNATHVSRTCFATPGRPDIAYCVRPILENLSVFCFKNARNQPVCGASATVGGEAWEGGFFFRSYLKFGATVFIYKVPGLSVGDRGILAAKTGSRGETGYYQTSPFSLTRGLGAPHLVGPVGGCLEVQATFFVRAETGWANGGVVLEPFVAKTHSHTIKSRRFCAPVFTD